MNKSFVQGFEKKVGLLKKLTKRHGAGALVGGLGGGIVNTQNSDEGKGVRDFLVGAGIGGLVGGGVQGGYRKLKFEQLRSIHNDPARKKLIYDGNLRDAMLAVQNAGLEKKAGAPGTIGFALGAAGRLKNNISKNIGNFITKNRERVRHEFRNGFMRGQRDPNHIKDLNKRINQKGSQQAEKHLSGSEYNKLRKSDPEALKAHTEAQQAANNPGTQKNNHLAHLGVGALALGGSMFGGHKLVNSLTSKDQEYGG